MPGRKSLRSPSTPAAVPSGQRCRPGRLVTGSKFEAPKLPGERRFLSGGTQDARPAGINRSMTAHFWRQGPRPTGPSSASTKRHVLRQCIGTLSPSCGIPLDSDGRHQRRPSENALPAPTSRRRSGRQSPTLAIRHRPTTLPATDSASPQASAEVSSRRQRRTRSGYDDTPTGETSARARSLAFQTSVLHSDAEPRGPLVRRRDRRDPRVSTIYTSRDAHSSVHSVRFARIRLE